MPALDGRGFHQELGRYDVSCPSYDALVARGCLNVFAGQPTVAGE